MGACSTTSRDLEKLSGKAERASKHMCELLGVSSWLIFSSVWVTVEVRTIIYSAQNTTLIVFPAMASNLPEEPKALWMVPGLRR